MSGLESAKVERGSLRRYFVISLLLLAAPVGAQDATAGAQRVEALRRQLRDVTENQTQLQAREQQLDEALKPENVERSVAGIGTTDATALRDQRRQQLEREKAALVEQLRSLDASRMRLEASIASAEAEAVRLRAAALGANRSPPQEVIAPAPVTASLVSPGEQKRGRIAKRRQRGRARRRGSPR
jgi:cell division protein FtsB